MYGPELHGLTDSGVKVWVATTSGGVAIRVDIRVPDGNVQASFSTVTSSTFPYEGFVSLTGLLPATTYEYLVYEAGSLVSGPTSFMTLPTAGSPGAADMILEFDLHENYESYAAVRQILAARAHIPTVRVTSGDYEGGGETTDPATWQDEALRAAQFLTRRDATLFPDKQAHGAKTPLFAGWDDWDSQGNNACADLAPNATGIAQRLWRKFYGNPYVVGDAIYHSFMLADCPVLVIDERSERTWCPGTQSVYIEIARPSDAEFDPDAAVFLGATQLQWIKDTLTANASAPFKFLVAGGTWTDNNRDGSYIDGGGGASRDSVGIFFRKERNELLAWLKANPAIAKGVILFTGDDHFPVIVESRDWREAYNAATQEYTEPAVEVASFPLIEFKPTGLGVCVNLLWRRAHDQDDVVDVWREESISCRVFGRVRLNTAKATPECIVELVSTGLAGDGGAGVYPAGYVLATVRGMDGTWYVDRSKSPNRNASTSYSSSSAPATSWTPKVIP